MTLIIMTLMFSLSFLFMKHPLTMGIILLIQTIIISLTSGMLYFNFWYSYILFLIMVGGMLILFIYMTSIASNEKFQFSLKISMMMMMFFFIITLMFLMMDSHFTSPISNIDSLNLNTNYELSLSKFINYPMNIILIMIIIYLFIALIAIVKITNIKIGPLRSSN